MSVGNEPRYIEFVPDSCDEIIQWMERLSLDRSGWMNFQPGIHPDDAPPPRGALSFLFGSRSSPVPVCTWVPGRRGGRADEPLSVGIEHPIPSKVMGRLEASGILVPTGWRVVQDHPRRGLVLAVPRHAEQKDVLSWLLRVGELLTDIPTTGTWRAALYLR